MRAAYEYYVYEYTDGRWHFCGYKNINETTDALVLVGVIRGRGHQVPSQVPGNIIIVSTRKLPAHTHKSTMNTTLKLLLGFCRYCLPLSLAFESCTSTTDCGSTRSFIK